MRRGGSPSTGVGRRQVLIRQNETYWRLVRRGAKSAPAFVCLRTALTLMLALAIGAVASVAAKAETRALKLYNTHTKERATIVYKRDGKYDKAGLAKVNQFLRDWRRNEPTKMDTQLLDLIWTVYQKSGSNEHISVVCGYRSPATNGALRKRSKGVAKNSQHMQGKAMDFFIPGVPIAELRALGLRAQVGGVGFYPSSNFVHMDTGSVRHWPRMSRQQLVKVFPNGKTIHVPSDGKPLPGYAQALASHKLRGKSSAIQIASVEEDEEEIAPKKSRKNVGEPVVIASVSNEADEDAFDTSAASETGETATFDPPLPRPSPLAGSVPEPALGYDSNGLGQVIVATAEPLPTSLQPGTDELPVIAYAGGDLASQHPKPFEFESASHWSSPPVPVALARAMAARDVSRPASLPIRPTAVVATVDVSRPLRAEAITTAVLAKHDGGTIRDVTPVFAYASTMEITTAPPPAPPKAVVMSSDGIPIPVANPLLTVASAPVQPMATGSIEPRAPRQFPSEDLTLTALDTLGLRLWIGDQSTRQKQYALLTMPDFSQIPSLLDKPELAYSAGFGDLAYQGLRTDRFSGPLMQLPTMIDLSSPARLAFR
jgi:uncharacterized protein YcbK (DUF882 family)